MLDKCNHPVSRQKMRKRTSSNGSVTVVTHCLECGAVVATIPKRELRVDVSTLEEMDKSISRRFWDAQMAEIDAKREADRSAWFAEHDAYLRSDEWRRRRAKVLARDNYTCRGCLERPAVEVHHLTYDRWKAELAMDLVSLCSVCHDHVHSYQRPKVGGER